MRKAILLAMAAAIVAMFAIPGSASAAWTKHHEENITNVELEITGTDLKFESQLGGVTCNSTISKVLFEAGSTGTVKTFEPEEQISVTSNCQGTGPIAGCDVHEASSDALPWVIHTATGTTVTVTSGTITSTLTGILCPHTVQLTGNTATMTVAAGEVNTTSTATLSGSGFQVDGDLGIGTATVSGTVHVLGTITYGI